MRDQEIIPHSAGKVLSRNGDTIAIAVHCRKCGRQAIYATDQLPDGYQVYHIRVTGEDGPHLPDEFRPIPYVEEEFEVVGSSLQDAHERAEFACTLRFQGHRTTWIINGLEHLDERF
ncbi:hypothetical protein [Hymenobacter psychrotolerans]|uniref:hypothetical protein n=1 Tax=Hymenobacter psychrotolerans TaxID=344998 RepID=UPI0014807BDB|nr:hypothetical protein [Hymenobacter psychrotolerans]